MKRLEYLGAKHFEKSNYQSFFVTFATQDDEHGI